MRSRILQRVIVSVCGIAVVAGALLSSGRSASAKPVGSRKESAPERKHLTPEVQKSIGRGLAYLAARQHENGSFGSGISYRQNVAVTALSGMAFLSAGHTPGRGKYGRNVEKAVGFILSRCRPNGYIIDENSASHGPMYGHGFATLFLAEAYGMSRRKDLRKKLENAVKLIVNTQNKEGGWRYHPRAKDADISVTVCQIMALRAARNSGISVPKTTVDRTIKFVRKSQNPDGGFRYQLTRQADSAFPRSAAGVITLYSAGIYEGKEIDRGLNYLMRYLPRGDVFRYESHYFYGHYYAVQAMWQAGGTHWDRWYPAIQDELLKRQSPRGGWSDAAICSEYGTAMACLVLQLPNSFLPIFQR